MQIATENDVTSLSWEFTISHVPLIYKVGKKSKPNIGLEIPDCNLGIKSVPMFGCAIPGIGIFHS